ncbi:unnamed protein product [Arabis nemorensis]|uniref:40S ribosomal protein SA n=1 Tax=Arabis nemorensis TaxID=586526 RepID=A0A565CUJ9_9BRAS|nr:unnamed protein product [Arabis nemorensis]
MSEYLVTMADQSQMERYVLNRRKDVKTWERLQMAVRMIATIDPQYVIVQSSSPYGQRRVSMFAHFTGGVKAIAGGHIPGTFSDKLRPCLLIVTDPITEHQSIKEPASRDIPILIIAFCDSDSSTVSVDIRIPTNNKGRHSIACFYWLLASMVLIRS